MQPLQKTFRALITTVGAIALVLVAFPSVSGAAATPEHAAAEEHRNDSAPNERQDTVTEDNDDNDGDTPNNVVDDDDNAHPSGKDRSVEPGGSGNQGNAQSDPDDDGRGPDRSNGGVDQPGGEGGEDKADQDGNNGCGNDDDFEDDNEGLCLGRENAPGQQPETGPDFCPDGETVITDDTDADNDGVADMCEPETGPDFCPDGETVITDETDADNDGVVDMCEPSTPSTPTIDVEDEKVVNTPTNEPTAPTEVEGEEVVNTPTSPDEPTAPTEVEGDELENLPLPTITEAPTVVPNVTSVVDTPVVLGDTVTRSVAARQQLPRTGASAAGLVPFGLTLLAAGFALQRSGRRASQHG